MSDFVQVASVADRLKQAMEYRGVKQIDLVRLTGINRSAISRYLSGEYEPKNNAIHKLAMALTVSEQWLLGYDVPMERGGKKLTPIDEGELSEKDLIILRAFRAAPKYLQDAALDVLASEERRRKEMDSDGARQ